MKFVDTATIKVHSGDGGKGHLSFRREKGVPKGGPDGGNGGKGGDVILIADSHLNTLLDFKFKPHYKADNGNPGEKSNKTGKNGNDLYIRVPCGTVITDTDDQNLSVDLINEGEEWIIAKGGRGGRGNAEFATPTVQAPRYSEDGESGVEREILLELKLIADVGIVGLPNVGKSTLISVISAAKPKIADYPFTTLVPNLGIVKISEGKSYTVADIPGLIEGASKGKGIGIQFLRHIERTSCLLFLIDSMSNDPVGDYKVLNKELKLYNPDIVRKKKIICFSRIDALNEELLNDVKKVKFKEKNTQVLYISSVVGTGLDVLKKALWEIITDTRND